MLNSVTEILSRVCNCDKTPTIGAIIFEIFIVLGTIICLYLISRFTKNFLKKYLLVACGIFIFEFFTGPMWINSHLGPWAYVYSDVSWVLTIGWATMILTTIVVVDKIFSRSKEWQRFICYILTLTVEVLIFESIVLKLGIRTYAPETLEVINNWYLPILAVPVKALYYIPTFIALVVGFFKYWNFELEKEPLVPVKNGKWLRNLFISIISVVFFELMIDPMVINAKMPSWSYFYRDLSFVMTGIWIIIIWLAVNLVDKFFIQLDTGKKFILYIFSASIIMTPLEAFFIQNGYRIYGPSSVANFSGVKTLFLNLPIEVVFAIPLYLALIISFIRYWEIILDNKK